MKVVLFFVEKNVIIHKFVGLDDVYYNKWLAYKAFHFLIYNNSQITLNTSTLSIIEKETVVVNNFMKKIT